MYEMLDTKKNNNVTVKELYWDEGERHDYVFFADLFLREVLPAELKAKGMKVFLLMKVNQTHRSVAFERTWDKTILPAGYRFTSSTVHELDGRRYLLSITEYDPSDNTLLDLLELLFPHEHRMPLLVFSADPVVEELAEDYLLNCNGFDYSDLLGFYGVSLVWFARFSGGSHIKCLGNG